MPFTEQDQVFNESRDLGTIEAIRVRRDASWSDNPGLGVERTAIKMIGRAVAYYDPALCVFCADVWVEGESYNGITAAALLEPCMTRSDKQRRRVVTTYVTRAIATREAIAHADWWYSTVEIARMMYCDDNDMPDEELIARAVDRGTVYTEAL